MNAAAKIGLDYLEAQGLSRIQAAAIIGNFIVESNLNPHALGDKNLREKAHGIGQWRGDRWSNLLTFSKTRGKSPWDFLLQLEYALVELHTIERFAGEKLFSATTIEDAVEGMIDFERPSGWTKKYPRHAKTWRVRLNAAKSVL